MTSIQEEHLPQAKAEIQKLLALGWKPVGAGYSLEVGMHKIEYVRFLWEDVLTSEEFKLYRGETRR